MCTCPRTSTVFTPVMPASCSQKQIVNMRGSMMQELLAHPSAIGFLWQEKKQ